jgi:hypothetical protein
MGNVYGSVGPDWSCMNLNARAKAGRYGQQSRPYTLPAEEPALTAGRRAGPLCRSQALPTPSDCTVASKHAQGEDRDDDQGQQAPRMACSRVGRLVRSLHVGGD